MFFQKTLDIEPKMFGCLTLNFGPKPKPPDVEFRSKLRWIRGLNLLTAAAVTSQIIMSVQALGSIRALDFFGGRNIWKVMQPTAMMFTYKWYVTVVCSKANSRLIGLSQWRVWSIWPGAFASHVIAWVGARVGEPEKFWSNEIHISKFWSSFKTGRISTESEQKPFQILRTDTCFFHALPGYWPWISTLSKLDACLARMIPPWSFSASCCSLVISWVIWWET